MPDQHNPYQLYADLLSEDDRPELIHLDCGNESWSRAATEWIQGSDVWKSIYDRGTKVWLYRNELGVVVGFGSLGMARRKWPPPGGAYTNLLIIPMLGLDHRFHGQPSEVRFRYSHQVMAQLRYEAIQLLQKRHEPALARYRYRCMYIATMFEQFGSTNDSGLLVNPQGREVNFC